MSLPQRLFLYGTLLHGTCNPVAVRLHRHLTPGVAGWVPGRLFALPDPAGWYPALVPGEGVVRGMVHAAGPGFDGDLLAALDAYEEVSDDGLGAYRRETVVATTAEGECLAEAYICNAKLPTGALMLPDGDFLAFLAGNGLSAFS